MLSEATWAWLLLFTAGCLVGGGSSSLQLRTQVCPESGFWSCFLAQSECRACSVQLQSQCHVQGNANRTASIKPYLPWVTLSLCTLPSVAAGTSELGPAGLRENAIFLSNSNQENKRITTWNAHPKPEKPWSQNQEEPAGRKLGRPEQRDGQSHDSSPSPGYTTQAAKWNSETYRLSNSVHALTSYVDDPVARPLRKWFHIMHLTETIYSKHCHKKQPGEHESQFFKQIA